MNNFIKFKDAIQGNVFLDSTVSGKKKYQKTKDATSKSGHSIIANIEMTHSGIVTRNLGFYLPDNMKRGAHTFNKNYNKPVLVGHDEDSDPVGRVIDANYIDTSGEYKIKDKYLSSMFEFVDKKKGGGKEELTDFVQYVIQNYSDKSNYRGMGHILGSLKISDEEAIQKVLDERFLTVSTSMMSDAARCSECGQDWISEGQCEHERGQVYDSGVPVVIIPGSQSYGHVGFVSEPADVFASGFKGVEIIKDGIIKNLTNDNDLAFTDNFKVAANLFTYKDSQLISLSDEKETDLIQVKNNIQRIEDSLNKEMENVVMNYADQIEATISLWSNGEDGESTSVRISKYIKELSSEDLATLSKKAMAALDSTEFENETKFKDALQEVVEKLIPEEEAATEEVTADSTEETPSIEMKAVKVLNDKFKLVDGEEYAVDSEEKVLDSILELKDADISKREAKDLAKLIVRSEHNDAIASLTILSKDKKIEECVTEFKELKDKLFKLGESSEEEILTKMNELLAEDHKISEEAFETLDGKTCAGSRKYFPVTSKETADAARVILGLSKAADSLKGRILGNIEKLSAGFESSEDSSSKDAENFDTSNDSSDNQVAVNDETLLENLNKLLDQAEERGLLEKAISSHLDEKQQEIEILEQQLDLANDDVEKLEGQLSTFKDEAKRQLAETVVDAKIKSGLLKEDARDEEIKSHLERSEDSLKDAAKDFGAFKTEEVKKTTDLKKVDDPVLADSATSANEQFEDGSEDVKNAQEERKNKETQKRYQLLKAQKGKPFADNWLNRRA